MLKDNKLLENIKNNKLNYLLFIIFIIVLSVGWGLIHHGTQNKNKISESFGILFLFGDFVYGAVIIYMFKLYTYCGCGDKSNTNFYPYVDDENINQEDGQYVPDVPVVFEDNDFRVNFIDPDK